MIGKSLLENPTNKAGEPIPSCDHIRRRNK
jgi:hypothetical protein